MNFLEVVIGQGKIEIKENKIAEVLNWPTLKTVRDIRKFLDLTNYYKQFVKNFVRIAHSLNNLTRLEEKWNWEVE